MREKLGQLIFILKCEITVAPEAVPHRSKVKAYLGRPWRNYYATVGFMESYIDGIVPPKGWMPLENNTDMFYRVQ